jgi:hypothetical protein
LIAPDYDDVEQAIAFNWSGAIAYCDSYTINGFSDWRIGTKEEMSFVDIGSTYIPNFVPNNFWTGTEIDSTHAWKISMNGSGTGTTSEVKSNVYFALPIKSF